mmetsp:Transcript_10004/g.27262  ORF Transcript_10004/g.27262 Transcript_10004/m.27262 type:complete len:229 (-) Transcript_10004:1879-2565(-)
MPASSSRAAFSWRSCSRSARYHFGGDFASIASSSKRTRREELGEAAIAPSSKNCMRRCFIFRAKLVLSLFSADLGVAAAAAASAAGAHSLATKRSWSIQTVSASVPSSACDRRGAVRRSGVWQIASPPRRWWSWPFASSTSLPSFSPLLCKLVMSARTRALPSSQATAAFSALPASTCSSRASASGPPRRRATFESSSVSLQPSWAMRASLTCRLGLGVGWRNLAGGS